MIIRCIANRCGAGRLALLAVLLAVAAHITLVLREYPPGVLTRGEIPLKGDVARYYATAYGTAGTGGLYGYDPYSMAGYPVGLWNSMGKKGFEVLHLLCPSVPLPALFYSVLAGGAFLAPLLLWLGLRRFCEDRAQSLILFILSILYWDLDTQLSYFWRFGNVFFPLAAVLACIAAGFLRDLLSGARRLFSALMLAFLSTCVFYCHTVVLVALGLAVLPVLFVKFSALKSALTWLHLALAAFLFALAALPWFLPLWAGRSECVSQPAEWWQATWKNLLMDMFSDRVYEHHFDRNLLLHVAVVLGGVGTVLGFLRKKDFVIQAGCAGALILALSYAGSYAGPAAAIQPYRFLQVATLFLLVPAATAAAWFWETVRNASREIRIAAGTVLVVIMPAFTGYLLDLAGPVEPCGVPRSLGTMKAAIDRLDPAGRILCDEPVLAHAVPWLCRRPVLGGLSTQAFLKHRFAGVDDKGRIFGKGAAEWQAGELAGYLDAYAVDCAIFTRGDWVAFADRPESPFAFLEAEGRYRIYRVKDAKPSFVLKGGGEAKADFNRIAVTGTAAADIILKFHYEPWLVADNGVKIEPERVLDDPIPFIRCRIPAGVNVFTIVRMK